MGAVYDGDLKAEAVGLARGDGVEGRGEARVPLLGDELPEVGPAYLLYFLRTRVLSWVSRIHVIDIREIYEALRAEILCHQHGVVVGRATRLPAGGDKDGLIGIDRYRWIPDDLGVCVLRKDIAQELSVEASHMDAEPIEVFLRERRDGVCRLLVATTYLATTGDDDEGEPCPSLLEEERLKTGEEIGINLVRDNKRTPD